MISVPVWVYALTVGFAFGLGATFGWHDREANPDLDFWGALKPQGLPSRHEAERRGSPSFSLMEIGYEIDRVSDYKESAD